MTRTLYTILLWGSCLGAALAIVVAALVGDPWRMLAAALSGGLASLAASTAIQWLASAEQSDMIRSVTLSIPGVSALPQDFLDLKWMAHTTQVASDSSTPAIVGRFSPLKKLRTLGTNIVEYEIVTTNPAQKHVRYACTFIGLEGCVAGVIAKEGETTSVAVFDAPVPDVELYFGAGYLTTWLGGRSSSFQLVGVSPIPTRFTDLPPEERRRFAEWFTAVRWDVRDGYAAFTEGDPV